MLYKSSWLKVSMAISLSVLVSFLFVNNTMARENLAEKATTLMEKEQFQKVYDLLLKESPGKKGDNEILFLKGMAAYKLKYYKKAAAYFKAILARNPNLPRVRLELARTYAAKGKKGEAREHFKRVLEMHPPPQVRKNIESYLAMLEEKKNWDLNLAVGYLYDDNVNAGPTTDTVELFGIPFKLGPKAKEQSDSGVITRVSFDHKLSFPDNLALHSQVRFNSVSYFDLTEFNTEEIYLSTGPKKILNRFLLSLPLIYDYIRVGSDSYSQSFGASPSIKYALSHNLYLAGDIYATKRDYYDRDNRDGELYSLDLSLKKAFQNWFIKGGCEYTLEETEKEFLDNDAWSLYGAFYSELPLNLSIYISPKISWKDYDEKEAIFDRTREDEIYTVNANLSKELGDSSFSITLGYTYTRDNANLPLYEYTRNQITFQLSKQF